MHIHYHNPKQPLHYITVCAEVGVHLRDQRVKLLGHLLLCLTVCVDVCRSISAAVYVKRVKPSVYTV